MSWMSIWMIAVAVLHTLVGCIVFRKALGAIVRDGLLNAIDNVERKTAFWFVMAGPLMLVIGLLLAQTPVVSTGAAATLLALALLGVIAIPKSGFWFLLPPALALLAHSL